MLTYFIIIKMILSLTPSCATNNVITIIFFNLAYVVWFPLFLLHHVLWNVPHDHC